MIGLTCHARIWYSSCFRKKSKCVIARSSFRRNSEIMSDANMDSVWNYMKNQKMAVPSTWDWTEGLGTSVFLFRLEIKLPTLKLCFRNTFPMIDRHVLCCLARYSVHTCAVLHMVASKDSALQGIPFILVVLHSVACKDSYCDKWQHPP